MGVREYLSIGSAGFTMLAAMAVLLPNPLVGKLMQICITIIGFIASLIPVIGSRRAAHTVGPARAASGTAPAQMQARPLPSFWGGLTGGFVGGAIAGVIIGAGYDYGLAHWNPPYPVSVRVISFASIVLSASITGSAIGGAMCLGMIGFGRLAGEKRGRRLVFNQATGAIVGATMAATIFGAVNGAYFGLKDFPFINPGLIAVGAILGAMFIALGALLYEYEGSAGSMLRAFLLAAVFTGLLAMLGIVAATSQAETIYTRFFAGARVTQALAGGAALGLAFGLIGGIQVACTMSVYRLLGRITAPTPV